MGIEAARQALPDARGGPGGTEHPAHHHGLRQSGGQPDAAPVHPRARPAGGGRDRSGAARRGPVLSAAAGPRLSSHGRARGELPIRPDSALRRLVDVIVAVVGLVVCSPVLVVASAAVRASSRGPVVFRQQRVGRGGEHFTIWKFRTMVADAPAMGGSVSGRRDPRVTPVGRFLRGPRLDELPQLVNLLRGDMTLIGPRPEVPCFVRHYTPEERLLLTVRPGVLGPGAVLFARDQSHELDDAEDPDDLYVRDHLHPKLALDLDYLRDRRLRTDLRLIGAAVAVSCQLGIR